MYIYIYMNIPSPRACSARRRTTHVMALVSAKTEKMRKLAEVPLRGSGS